MCKHSCERENEAKITWGGPQIVFAPKLKLRSTPFLLPSPLPSTPSPLTLTPLSPSPLQPKIPRPHEIAANKHVTAYVDTRKRSNSASK
jgi:hypothetical protein